MGSVTLPKALKVQPPWQLRGFDSRVSCLPGDVSQETWMGRDYCVIKPPAHYGYYLPLPPPPPSPLWGRGLGGKLYATFKWSTLVN